MKVGMIIRRLKPTLIRFFFWLQKPYLTLPQVVKKSYSRDICHKSQILVSSE